MPVETEVLRLLLAYQEVWFTHFPMLSRRAEWHIVHHLCMKGRAGAPVGELYGLAKQIFLLDDATVKDRLLSINQMGLCELEPAGQIYARTVTTPTPDLLLLFDRHLAAFAMVLSETARRLGTTRLLPQPLDLTAQERAWLLHPLDFYNEHWNLALDRVFEAGNLSPARRIDAKRNLISSSHWNLIHRTIDWHYEAAGNAAESNGILADRLAAQLLQLTGQTLQTTRDHIAYLLDLGLFERRPGRKLHVAMSDHANTEIHRALGFTADRLPAVLDAIFRRAESAPGTVAPTAWAPAPEGTASGGSTVWHRRLPDPNELIDRTANIKPDQPPAAWNGTLHFLEVVKPAGDNRRIPVHPPMTIGRMEPSDLVLNSADVSRSHCRIVEDGVDVAVTDLKSTNGTFLNDQRIAATIPLKAGDRLQVGSYVLVYRQESTAAAAFHPNSTLRAQPSSRPGHSTQPQPASLPYNAGLMPLGLQPRGLETSAKETSARKTSNDEAGGQKPDGMRLLTEQTRKFGGTSRP